MFQLVVMLEEQMKFEYVLLDIAGGDVKNQKFSFRLFGFDLSLYVILLHVSSFGFVVHE